MSRAERRRMERETKGGGVSPNQPEKIKAATRFVAESFLLVDKAGRHRGGMMVDPDGVASLALFDKNGEIRASLIVEGDGTSKLVVNDMVVKFEKDLGAPGT